MSTYYYFACESCKKRGGFLSRQAWGWGNFDIIETFKFLTHHYNHRPFLVDENSEESEWSEHKRKEFVETTHKIMPHSNDWSLVNEHEWSDVEKKWEEDFLKKPDYDYDT